MADTARRPQAAPNLARRRSISQLAREWNVHRNTARRLLMALHQRHGGVLFCTSSAHRPKLWTTYAAIRQADPRFLEERELKADRQDVLEKRVQKLEAENRNMRRMFREALAALTANQSAPKCTNLHHG